MPVTVLEWPAQDEQRCEIARLGLPRLLLVDRDGPRPATSDPLEDWAVHPVDPSEMRVRISLLERRHEAQPPRPVLEADGTLRVGDRAVRVTERERAILAPLLAQVGQPIRRCVVDEAYVQAGGTDDPAAVRTAFTRLRKRLVEVGMVLHVLRGRAVMLELVGSQMSRESETF